MFCHYFTNITTIYIISTGCIAYTIYAIIGTSKYCSDFEILGRRVRNSECVTRRSSVLKLSVFYYFPKELHRTTVRPKPDENGGGIDIEELRINA